MSKSNTLYIALLATLISACGPQESINTLDDNKAEKPAETHLKSGISLANMDKSVRPQDDFYQYVNGNWLNNTSIPSDKSSYGSFIVLADKSRQDVKAIIEETAQLKNVEQGSDAQKVGDLYKSYMNLDKLNELGITPLNQDLAKIAAIKSHDDVAAYFAEAQVLGSSAPFRFFVNNDSKNPTAYITYFSQSGLGLPDKQYYFKGDEKSIQLRKDYLAHIEKMLTLANISDTQAKAASIMELETAIADIHWERTERRDRNKTYNKVALSELPTIIPDFNWSVYLEKAGIAKEEATIIREKSYFEDFSKLFANTKVEDWQAYFKWHLIRSSASILSDEFNQASFDFYSTKLRGTPEQEERWKRAVGSVNRLLGEVVGKIYVQKHFKPEAKARMLELVENLRKREQDG